MKQILQLIKPFREMRKIVTLCLALFLCVGGLWAQTTVTYGWETSDDATQWTITDAIVATSGQGNTGTYAGKINTNHTYVQFKNKVYVTSFPLHLSVPPTTATTMFTLKHQQMETLGPRLKLTQWVVFQMELIQQRPIHLMVLPNIMLDSIATILLPSDMLTMFL